MVHCCGRQANKRRVDVHKEATVLYNELPWFCKVSVVNDIDQFARGESELTSQYASFSRLNSSFEQAMNYLSPCSFGTREPVSFQEPLHFAAYFVQLFRLEAVDTIYCLFDVMRHLCPGRGHLGQCLALG
jgi:hypothetical protein